MKVHRKIRTLSRSVFCVLCPLSFVLCLVACQPTDPIDQKVEALLAQMTLEEKLGQMNQLNSGWINPEICKQIKAGQVGAILNTVNYEEFMTYQRLAVDSTRLGIPLVFARDIIHGFRTIFPIPIGQAATWNPALVEKAARITAQEATQTGVRWTFSPMVDISRDPRWGRLAEGYGEDTYLTSQMGAATVRGYQGEDLTQTNTLAACVKHFAAYGASESGRDYNTTWIPEVLLRDVYLPPFKAAIDAGSASIMCSFNDINGVPSSANKHLNIDILRKEWGYDGLLDSDWWSSANMVPHGYSKDLKEAALQSINAGMEMDMEGYGYLWYLDDLLAEGKIQESQIDDAVRSILRFKFRLGLFDNPYTAIENPEYFTEEALATATQAVEESATLLKNNGILPLKVQDSRLKTLMVCGPLSNSQHDQHGTWCFDGVDSMAVTPLAAFQEWGEANDVRIIYEAGTTYSREEDAAAVRKAVRKARQADVVLFFAGEESILSGEARCRAELSLPGMQTEMLEQLKETGKPIVMVVMAGRPLTIGHEVDLCDAVIYSYHGGTMAGPGLCNVLTGKVSPSGRVPMTIPQLVGQVPIYYNKKNTGRPTHNPILMDEIAVNAPQFSLGQSSYHLEVGNDPLYAFGYGLTYTTFAYSPVTLSDTILTADGSITASCTVTNTGKVDAKEVIQLYVRDLVGDCRPIRELKGFEKVLIKAGESYTATFTITPDELAYWHNEYTDTRTQRCYLTTDPGDFHVWISPSSDTGEPVKFTLVE